MNLIINVISVADVQARKLNNLIKQPRLDVFI